MEDLNSIFTLREVNAINYPAFQTGSYMVYGEKSMAMLRRYNARLDPNGTFIRIMLFILAFSTNSSFVVFDSSADIRPESTSIEIMNVQNIFINMFCKYLIYQFNFTEAVRWFSSFVKYILDVMQSSYEGQEALNTMKWSKKLHVY